MPNDFDLESQPSQFSKGEGEKAQVRGSSSNQAESPNSLCENIGQSDGKRSSVNFQDGDPHSQNFANKIRENVAQIRDILQASHSIKPANGWERVGLLMKEGDNAMCNAWREEIEKLLIFAGLFSATVTAFIVESYKWLQPESNDITAQYLGFLTAQFTQTQNITLPETLSRLNNPPVITSSAIRINIFWFLSLILSLSAVFIGILGFQWLREFQEEVPNLSPEEAVSLRQIKFNGLRSWRVPAILASISLLLQAALVLFFGGILDLLWHRNHTVAAVITVVVGAIILFLAITTIAPALQYIWYRPRYIRHRVRLIPQCPFKSTQSWVILRLTLWVQGIKRRIQSFIKPRDDLRRGFVRDDFFSWVTYDLYWQRLELPWGGPQGQLAASEAIDWMSSTWSRSVNVIDTLDGCLADMDIDDAETLVLKLHRDRFKSIISLRNDLSIFRATGKHRAIISIYFLSLYIKQHPILWPKWVKMVLQTYDNDHDTYQNPWLSKVLELLQSQPAKFEPATMVQAIHALRMHCNKHPSAVSQQHIVYGWKVLQILSWNDDNTYRKVLSLKDLNSGHFKLACSVSKAFQTMLQLNMDHILGSICASTLCFSFIPPELKQEDILELSQTFPEFADIVNLVKFLDASAKENQWYYSWLEPAWFDFTSKFAPLYIIKKSDIDGPCQ